MNELDRLAPCAPLLALGQTVFWDEPMKAGLAALTNRPLVAGIHDTDYFAKLPGGKGGGFRSLPHNDTTTKGLWSAAAEFSALFGSETVVTREILQSHGARIEKLLRARPNLLDCATEAWGWRGVVALGEHAPITAEVDLKELYPELRKALEWAIELTLQSVSEPDRVIAASRAEGLLKMFDVAAEGSSNLADFYEKLLVPIYSFVLGELAMVQTTRTTELLRFNTRTSGSPRFDLVELFVNPETAEVARQAYNEAISGSETYGLERFMSGAIPFDLVIPGLGRGTIRIANRGFVIMTPVPQFISLKAPLRNLADFATAVEKKFGPDCTLIGKAVTLIGMLAREFVFVFHEGASRYVKRSRAFHQGLAAAGHPLRMNPILRIRYHVWDSLAECRSWLKLPEVLQGPFGAEDICTPSFASRWQEVQTAQTQLLDEIAACRRPVDLIALLGEQAGGSWKCLSKEYGQIHDRLQDLDQRMNELRMERRRLYPELKALRRKRAEAEVAMGEHWRSRIFEKDPTSQDVGNRAQLGHAVDVLVHEIASLKARIRGFMHQQRDVARDPAVVADHERRREIELEAELKRLKLIRSAVVASSGLQASDMRPSAWWFPVLCADGGWYRETLRTADSYLEHIA